MLKLNEEKKKLEYMIEQNKSYKEILKQSQIVDKCIIDYYTQNGDSVIQNKKIFI